jgi:hypothetical protein
MNMMRSNVYRNILKLLLFENQYKIVLFAVITVLLNKIYI